MIYNDEKTVVVEDGSEDVQEDPDSTDEACETHMDESVRQTDQTLADWADMLKKRRGSAGESPGLPVLPVPPTEDREGESAAIMRTVRRFHQGVLPDVDELQRPDEGFVPALLYPFRNHAKIRHDYPLVLFPPGVAECDRLFMPLSELLQQAIGEIAPGEDDARILKDNRARLEMHVNETLIGRVEPVNAVDCLNGAGAIVLDELSLNAENAQQLREGIQSIVATIPGEATLLTLHKDTITDLYIHAARHRAVTRQSKLRDQAGLIRNKLHDLLRADREKEAEGRAPESLSKTAGAAGAMHIDPEQFSRVIGSARGAEPMEPDRHQRLERMIGILDRFLARDRTHALTLIHTGDDDRASKGDDIIWRTVESDVCKAASEVFDEEARAYAELFGALRVGRLEMAGAYDPQRHDALLESFRWEFFSREELLSMPPILVLESTSQLSGAGMFNLSNMLLSGRTVSVLVTVHPADDSILEPEEARIAGNRFELAYLGISHREAQVHQSSTARPHHLLDGFVSSLDATCAALHVVADRPADVGSPLRLGSWLHAAAALEGRAHPFSHYNPEAGATWARRFDFADNPQPEADWPVHDLPCGTVEGDEESLTLAFTFADFALLEDRYRAHFRVIPSHCTSEDLIALDQFLVLDQVEAEDRIPFIWAADEQGVLHRIVVSRHLVVACRDRLNYWRTLQELAGIHNEHVREAVEYERERLVVEFQAERKQAEESYEAELDRVRRETAGEAFGRLAEALLGTDASALSTTLLKTPGAAAAPSGAPATAPSEAVGADVSAPSEAAEAEPEEEEEGELGDPWIDTALCTTCNDCMQINAQVFVYNSNKQALIGDAEAGTFAQIVKAAEICPAHCIHPGKPLHPDEPSLDELIERAKPFQ